jgi:long-chain acyl-CoA synthetase
LVIQQERPWMKQYPAAVDLSFDIPEVNLYSLVEAAETKYSELLALVFDGENITYRELKESVDRLAGAWHQLGAEKGERLGLMVSNCPAYVIAYYAALKLGMVVVQINPMYTERELLEIFRDSGITYLVTEPDGIEKISYPIQQLFTIGKREGFRTIYELIENSAPLSDTCHISSKNDIAVIQYTGGTTGVKKGAMLTHFNIMANVFQSKALYGEAMQFGEETILTAIPLYHVYGMTSGMNLAIYIGAVNVLVDRFDLEKVLNIIEAHKPTFFPGVPKMYNAFVNYPGIKRRDLSSFKMCTSGSAPLPVEIIKQFERLTGVAIGEGYGLSETSPSTHRNPPGGTWKIGSIGIPLPKTDCRIVDEKGQDLPPTAIGELLIKGPQVMLGYWNKPEETSTALVDGWLYTGD